MCSRARIRINGTQRLAIPAQSRTCRNRLILSASRFLGDPHDPVLSPPSLLPACDSRCALTPVWQNPIPTASSSITTFASSPDEKVGDVTCIGCSIYVRGQVSGDVTAIAGSVFAESRRLDRGRRHRHWRQCPRRERRPGGRRPDRDWRDLRRDPQASVAGDVTTVGGGGGWIFLIFLLPFLFLGGIIALIIWLIQRSRHPPQSPPTPCAGTDETRVVAGDSPALASVHRRTAICRAGATPVRAGTPTGQRGRGRPRHTAGTAYSTQHSLVNRPHLAERPIQFALQPIRKLALQNLPGQLLGDLPPVLGRGQPLARPPTTRRATCSTVRNNSAAWSSTPASLLSRTPESTQRHSRSRKLPRLSATPCFTSRKLVMKSMS